MNLKTLFRFIPKRWLRWLRLIAGVIVFAVFAAVVLDNWRQLTDISWHLDVAPLALSACLLLMTYYLNVLGWHRIVASLGGASTFEETARIWMYSNLARYLPGSVWYAAGRVVLGNNAGISPVTTSVGMVLEIAFLLISRVLVVVATWPLWTSHTLPEIPWFLSAVLIIGALSVVHPGVLNWFFAQYQRLRGQESSAGDSIQLQYRDTLQILAIFVGQALFIGVAFYFLARALVPLPLDSMPFVAGVFTLAWLIGFVSLFAPSGLGVREGVLAYLLSPTVTEPTAIMMAVLSRAWLVAAELFCVALVKLAESCGSTSNLGRREYEHSDD
jgi:uncharacterized membrane protein YbhN (UPF0104 family)